MTTYTLTGQITDFGDVAATNVTGTVDAAAQVDGSSQLVALHDCYYSDDGGTTLTKATAGPFPLAHVAQVL